MKSIQKPLYNFAYLVITINSKLYKHFSKISLFVVFLYCFCSAAQINNNSIQVIQNGHHDIITDLIFSPNGDKLASSSEDKTIIIWDVHSGKEFTMLKGHLDGVNKIVFSPDGKYLVSGGNRKDQQLIFWDWDKEKIVKKIKNASSRAVNSLAFHPNGKILVSGSHQEISVWDCKSYQKLYKIGGKKLPYSELPIKGNVNSISFSRDGKKMAIGIDNGEVQIRNTESGILLQSLNVDSHQGKILTLAFDENDQILYTAGSTDNIITWDIMLGQAKNYFPSTSLGFPCPCKFSADFKRFAALCNGILKIQEMQNGKEIFKNENRLFENQALAFHPINNNIIAFSGIDIRNKNAIILIDINSGHPIKTLKGYRSGVTSLSFSLDGKYLLSGSKNESPKLWNLSSGLGYTTFNEKEKHINSQFATVKFSNNDQSVFKGTENELTSWDIKSKKQLFNIKTGAKEPQNFVVSDNHNFVAQINNGIKIYDIKKEKIIKELKGPRLKTRSIAIYNKGNQLLSGGFKEIKKWEINNFNALNSLIIPDYAWEIAVKPNDNIIATCENESNIVLREINSGTFITTITNKGKNVTFSPNGKYLATSYGDTLFIWDSEKYGLIHKLGGHSNKINSISFNPKGKILATGSEDSSIKLWNYTEGKLIATLIASNEEDYLIITSENYFMSSKNGVKTIALKKDKKMYPLEQFDLIYNRPDTVIEHLNLSDNKIVKYHKENHKRINLDYNLFSPEFHLPTLKLIGHSIPLSTKEKLLTFKLMASDKKYKLERLHVLVNGTPIYGANGLKLKVNAYHTSTTLESVELELTNGLNKIEVYVQNEKGVYSLKEYVEVFYEGPKNNSSLILIEIGISKYVNSKMNCISPSYDINKIAELFENNKSKFSNVKTYSFNDENGTQLNILGLKDILNKSLIDDKILIFISGYGLTDNDLNYYIAPHDVNFSNPIEKGFNLREFEKILNNIPARNKLVLLDMINPFVDEQDIAKFNSELLYSKSYKLDNYNKRMSLNSTIEIMESQISFVEKITGSNFISFASGTEFLLKSDKKQKGIFAHYFIRGVESFEADLNQDKKITVSELQLYLSNKIVSATDNNKKMIGKKSHIINDFQIW